MVESKRISKSNTDKKEHHNDAVPILFVGTSDVADECGECKICVMPMILELAVKDRLVELVAFEPTCGGENVTVISVLSACTALA